MSRTVADTIAAHRAFVIKNSIHSRLIADGETGEEAARFIGTLLADRLSGHTVPELRAHLDGAPGVKAVLISRIVATVCEPDHLAPAASAAYREAADGPGGDPFAGLT